MYVKCVLKSFAIYSTLIYYKLHGVLCFLALNHENPSNYKKFTWISVIKLTRAVEKKIRIFFDKCTKNVQKACAKLEKMI